MPAPPSQPGLPAPLAELVQASDRFWIPAELTPENKEVLKYFITGSEKLEQYKDRFTILGKATRSGSLYALFHSGSDPKEFPVLVMGDEGGALVLAANVLQLMRFWTLGPVYPYVSSMDQSRFQLIQEPAVGRDIKPYCQWLQQHFGLLPLAGIEQAGKEIIAPAQARHQAAINAIFAA